MVCGYARVSDQKFKTDGERRQDINRQIKKIEAYCEMMELPKPRFFIDDGISAYKDDYNSRPDFVRMLNEVKANREKHIIIEDITRWSRRIEDGLKTLREVTSKCQVTSLAEGELGVTIPEQWFKSAIGFLMAEWSSKSTAYKVKSGMEKRLDDPKAICESCGIVHLGRHPASCMCEGCRKRKGRSKVPRKNQSNQGTSEG